MHALVGGGYREGSGARDERRSSRSREPGERGDRGERERERRDDDPRRSGGGYDRHERSGGGGRDYHSGRERERSPGRWVLQCILGTFAGSAAGPARLTARRKGPVLLRVP